MNRPAKIIAVCIVAIAGTWLSLNWWANQNPYARDGLQVEWSYGATSTVPSLRMWVDYRGQRIECPVFFGGIEFPELSFRDFDGDGTRDIVFANAKYKQVVSFTPAHGDSPPQFRIIRNDVYWP